jgi:predicted unusual protein kinase regulating ubiquinone biosynthesis (AarF/ABC1/UbiB family)
LTDSPADPPRATSHVPANRGSRLLHLGGLAVGLAGGILAEGARRAVRGELPQMRAMLLTPANAARLTDKLARLRGASMKVGQLLSMEAGELLPPEFTDILARLREDAHFMPLGQLAEVLETQWGEGWENRFDRFNFTPIAAASIGQVHAAQLKDGRRLAIKVQYPGVRRSIDSDVDNVAALLRLLPLLPAEANMDALLEEAKQQLNQEADYAQEAEHIARFRELLGHEADWLLPAVVDELTTSDVLCMSFVPGDPVESLVGAPQALRDHVATRLIDLLLREFMQFGMVQTDPNFANYRFDPESGRIGLLDFGATRVYSAERMGQVRQLMAAACAADAKALEAAALAAGYLLETDSASRRQAMIELFMLVGEPARQAGAYDFGNADLTLRLRDSAYAMGFDQGQWRPPPADLIFLHRKLAGLYLLCARLKARVDVAALMVLRLDEVACKVQG